MGTACNVQGKGDQGLTDVFDRRASVISKSLACSQSELCQRDFVVLVSCPPHQLFFTTYGPFSRPLGGQDLLAAALRSFNLPVLASLALICVYMLPYFANKIHSSRLSRPSPKDQDLNRVT